MARFDRYMLSQLLALFGFFALILVSIYWINQAVALFEQLISDGQSAVVFAQLSALTLPNIIRLVLPVAAFVSAVYITNRLSSESELAVMQATGFSPWRLARPALYFGLIVALLLMVLANLLVPAARGELATQRNAIANDATAQLLVEGSFQHPAPGLTIYIREISPQGELRDVFLSDARQPVRATTYASDRALLVRAPTGPKLVMFDGIAQTFDSGTRRLSTTRFVDFTYDIGALVQSSERSFIDRRELSTPRLIAEAPADLERTRSTPKEFRIEAQIRIAQPLTAAGMAVLGVAALLTGSFSRFGNARQITLAIGLVIILQLVSNIGELIADREGGIVAAVYLPVLAAALLNAGLLWWAGRSRRIPARAAVPKGATA